MGEEARYKEKVTLNSIEAYKKGLDDMFGYTLKIFEDYPDRRLKEYDCNLKVHVRWGQHFDVNQLCEHDIVHVLKHRRQIEKFILTLRA